MNLYVIVPTYNEKENLPLLFEQLLALPLELKVINVDDGSPDGTGAIADAWAAKDARVVAVHRAGKLGLGTAYMAGYAKAFSLGATHVLTMDADFSHNPKYIPAMVAKANAGFDLVIGSRYVGDGAMRGTPFYRNLLSWGANFVAKTALGLQANDTTAGFRLYRREVLESIELDKIFSSGYSFLVEMLYLVQRKGWRVGEVPIVYEDRTAGETKISRSEIMRALYTVARLTFRRFVRRK